MNTESTDPVPGTREEWRHCIEQWCRIELTPAFVQARIEALENPHDEQTQRFIECYGHQHHQQVLAWFKQAL
jgi:hypothetical protein